MTTLEDVVEIGRSAGFLAVVSTVRADLSVQSSVVNAGVLPHPMRRDEVLGFVTYGRAELVNLRARPQITVTFRSGGAWTAVEGRAELVGPDDAYPGIDDEGLRKLRRQVFSAAGGTHDDWAEYDRVMAATRRAVVLVTVTRVYSN